MLAQVKLVAPYRRKQEHERKLRYDSLIDDHAGGISAVKKRSSLQTIASQDRVDSITVENYQYSVTITDRQPSSHCAVNCNAQFTPHVDSGRGTGQKLSMIVGLGNYSGGELLVEGDPFNIKYEPLVFDGWKLRHWTNPFAGERFSLVWFTPESKSNDSME